MLRASRGALELWTDAARWWGGALVEGAAAAREENARVLGSAAERLAEQLQGRTVELELGGERVRGAFDSLRLRAGVQGPAMLMLREVRWRGFAIDSLSVLAERAAVTPPPSLALSVSGVRLHARLGLPGLLAHAGEELPRWHLVLSESGFVHATRGAWRCALEPVGLIPELTVELRELCWRRVRLRLPHWLRLSRRFPLPALPAGVCIIDARRDGSEIELVLSVPPLHRELRLREAGTA